MKLNIGWMNTGTYGSPDIVSRVPPFGEPLVGDTPETAGSDWKYFIDDATSITASPLKINKTYGRNPCYQRGACLSSAIRNTLGF